MSRHTTIDSSGASQFGAKALVRGFRAPFKALIATALPSRVAPQGMGERDQARIRLGIATLIILYTIAYIDLATVEARTGLPGLAVPLAFLAYAVMVLAWSLLRLEPSAARRIIGLLGDLGGISYFLALFGALAAPWYPIYLWITFGNAIRYGLRYLVASMVLSMIGFSLVIAISDFWQENLALAFGLLAGLGVLPIYTAHLLQSLNAALARSEEANRAKTRFLANMSHELRTPLNGVIAVGDMLAETRLSTDQRSMAETIRTSAHTLLGLIDRVLDISKIEAGRLDHHPQSFDLHELIQRAAEIVRPQAISKGLELELFVDSTLPHALVGSPAHLRQILLNLLGNAVKFTEQGHVALRVSGLGRIRNTVRVRFEIADTGIGIPQAAQSRIFEPFAQADESITRRYGGTGLGTTIAQQLVDLLGGRIEFESSEGAGTTFRFELELTVDESDAVAGTLDGMRVLAVGLGDADAVKLRRFAGEWGVEVSFAADARACEPDASLDAVLVNASQLKRADLESLKRPGMRRHLGNAPFIRIGAAGHNAADFAKAGYLSVVRDVSERTCLFRALHLARSGQVADRREGTFRRGGAPLRILLAEDNLTNQKVARMILEDAGHRVDLVEDGRAALSLLDETPYDLAILDMHMPEMGGVEAVQLYRFAHPESPMPFILLTADATTTAARMSEEAGIDAFLTKPVRPSTLQAAVRELTAGGQRAHERSPAPAAAQAPTRPAGPLDLATLNELAGMNAHRQGFLEDLVWVFLADADTRVRTMRTALATKDWYSFNHEAHRLKGAAGSIGAKSLYERCIAVNHLTPDDVSGDAADLLDAISEECHRARAALERYLEKLSRSSPAPPELLRSTG